MHLARAPLSRTLTWRPFAATTLALLLAACGGGGDDYAAGPGEPPQESCSTRANDTPERLLECVTLAGVQTHLRAFSDIAAAHGGSRASGNPGYEASLEYVEGLLRQAGYRVQRQTYSFPEFEPQAPAVLEERAPLQRAIAGDYLEYSGNGEVTAAVAVPSVLTGCEASDFASFPAGAIALVRRGDCDFSSKATNAYEAGAAAVVVFNHLDEPDLRGALGPEFDRDIPVLGVGRAEGERLLASLPQGLVLRVAANVLRRHAETMNLVAETDAGDPDHVVVLGAHLDSYPHTAGINDNGSGSAALLETALQLARVPTTNRLRFAFWGAEEHGLIGSTHYVEALDPAERERIALYLNFDMLGSPNYVFELYTGDGKTPEGATPRPSVAADLERVLASFYEARNLPWKRGVDEGRSDHAPFADHGIPFAGLFSGADAIKTEEEARLWGGRAGEYYDACYHKPCDNLSNIDPFALEVNTQAVAWLALYYANHRLPR